MRYDETKIDEAVLAVLYLTAWEEHGLTCAWKGIDWDASNRLHERGLIDDPRNKNKSIVFTEEGLALARASAEKLFSPQTASRVNFVERYDCFGCRPEPSNLSAAQ